LPRLSKPGKAGRAISDKNYAKIKAGYRSTKLKLIGALAENERSGKSNEGERGW